MRWAWRWWSTAALAALWVLLWGDFSVTNIVVGALLGLVVTNLLPMAPVPYQGRIRLWRLLRLLGYFLVELVIASTQVAVTALRFGYVPKGAVIGVRLRAHSDLYLTVTAELCSLLPGSVVIDAHRLTGTLYLHVLDAADDGIERVRRQVLDIEEHVLWALASDRELMDVAMMKKVK